MGSALLTMFGLALLCCLGVVHGEYMLIDTDSGEILEKTPNSNEEFGSDYGSHWTPKAYGHTPTPETEPVTCTWDLWGAWSGTSATCGSGTRTRSRVCRCSDGTTKGADSCGGGSSTESTQVNNGPCYTCNMGQWTQWSGSSVSCGTSTSNRSRTCVCTDGVSRPSECGGGSTTDSRTNNHGACPTAAPVWTPKPYRRHRMRRNNVGHRREISS